MSRITVSTSFNIDLEFELSPFHKRMLAWIIDLVIQIVYLLITFKILRQMNFMDDMESMDYLGVGALVYLPVLCYHILWEIFTNGQSPGKMVLGLQVINEDGGKPSLSQFFLRWLLRLVDFTITFGVGALISVLTNSKSQRIGDVAAGTILISTRQVKKMGNTVFMEIEDNYIPQYPQVMYLTDKDINRIRQMVEAAFERNDFGPLDIPAAKIKAALNIETKQEPAIFLRTLLKDYNYLSTR